MERFLAIHQLPAGWKDTLARIARRGQDVGVHPVETFYAQDRGMAYTLYDAHDPDSIRRLHASVGIEEPEVVRATQIFPELLAEARRNR